MKKVSLLRQTLHTLGSMAGNQGLQIAAGVAISRIYGPPGKGMVTYAGIAILGVIAIADGLSSAIARQCGDDATRIPTARAAALRLVLLVSACTALPLLLLGAGVPAQHALLYVGLALPFALYVQTMSGFHLIAQRVERTNIASLVINAGAALAMLVVAIAVRPPIDVIMSIWAAGYVAGAAILLPGSHAIGVASHEIRTFLATQTRFAVRASSAALMTFLASRADVFIVAATLSATALGNYTLALACGELMWQIGRALSWSAYGRVATLNFADAALLTARITRIVLAVEVTAAAVAFIVGPALFTLVYGVAFSAAGPVLRILVPGMALYAADSILSYFLSVKVGRPGLILRIETVTLVVCTAGSVATVARFGIVGPAVATTVAYLLSFSVKAALFSRFTGLGPAALILFRFADLQKGGVVGGEPVVSAIA